MVLSLDLDPECPRANATDLDLDQNPCVNVAVMRLEESLQGRGLKVAQFLFVIVTTPHCRAYNIIHCFDEYLVTF